MPLVSLIVLLVLIGIGLWLLNTYVPMAQPIKTLVNVLVIVVAFLLVLQAFGFLSYTIPVRR
jgi:hypothetical protein